MRRRCRRCSTTTPGSRAVRAAGYHEHLLDNLDGCSRRRGTAVNDALVGLSWAEAVAAAPPRDPLTPVRANRHHHDVHVAARRFVRAPPAEASDVRHRSRCSNCAACTNGPRLMSDDAFHREIGSDPDQPPRRTHRLHRAVAARRDASPAAVPRRAVRLRCRRRASSSPRSIPRARQRPHFVEGVEILEWNGVPIADAVRRRGESERGGRPDSAMARALDSLTFRPLGIGPPPDERWVIVGYRDGRRRDRSANTVSSGGSSTPGLRPTQPHPTAPAASAAAIHPDRALVRRAKKLSFNSGLWETEDDDRLSPLPAIGVADNGWITGSSRTTSRPVSSTVGGQRLRLPAAVELRAVGRRRLPRRGRAAAGRAASGRADHRPARQPRRVDLGGRTVAATVHTDVDLADPLLDHRLRPHPGDDRRPAEPAIAEPVATHPARRDRHR